jgi:hypothetical protein
MTDGDLAAQRVRIDEFGWIPIGTEVETSAGPVDLGIDIYACPLCGGLVIDVWRLIHMDHHDAPADS